MLKKFKSLFIIEEEGTSPESQTPVEKSASPQKDVPAPTRSFQVPVGSTGPGKVQDRFLDVLFDALEANNQDGFDYMEFKDFLKSLAKLSMDDETRYKSAFATAQTMGATKEKIVSSAQHYIGILSREQSKFQEALNGQRDRNLTGKQDEIKQLEQTIKNKEAEIEKLKADLEGHRQQISNLEKEINTASEKLVQTANDFEATYQALLGQIELDVKNIESHI
jgi:capsule polysaccharide export protein KpsE/RkpR